MRRSAALLIGLLFSLGSATSLDSQEVGVKKGAATITEHDMRRRIEIIADDSMEGRDTPSRGLEKTAAYIADEFKRLRLTPAGDGDSFVQRYSIPRHRLHPPLSATDDESRAPTAPNVAAILEGSDPVLRHEYIAFSAHMDHMGIRSGVNGDSIYNGADDDASGTAAVLELAEAYASAGARPRRSLLFLAVSGEEKGLWGSDYFAAHPPVPLEQIVANLNLDMIGRNWKDTIAVIGLEHSDLGTTLLRVSSAHPSLDMQPVGDLWPNERFYYRSDHYSFARRGVPILFFFSGTHVDYHRASDSADKIDAEKAARLVRLIYHLGQAVGNADARPRWNPDSYKRIVDKDYRH